MSIRTKHFNTFTDTKLLCTCGHAECDHRSVNQETLNRAERVRVTVDRPILVTSGGRCPYHPDEVHRTTPADHQKCAAMDVKVTGGLERGEIVAAGLMAGFNAIGVAKTFVHLGYREELKHSEVVMWTY